MNTFESFYRDEWQRLTEHLQQLVQQQPQLAEVFPLQGDPDLARVMEGFSALIAHLRQKIDNTFPELTHPLLATIWPFPLRPLPATSVISYLAMDKPTTHPLQLPAHTVFFTAPPESTPFFTSQPLHIEPLLITARSLHKTPQQSTLQLTFRYTGKSPAHFTKPITLLLSKDPATASLLQLWLEQYLTATQLRQQEKEWLVDIEIGTPVTEQQPCLLPMAQSAFWPLQQWIEFFCLPYSQHFITLDFSQGVRELQLSTNEEFTLVITFDGALPLTEEQVQQAFLPHTVPVFQLALQQHRIPLLPGKSDYQLPLPSLYQLHRVTAHNNPKTEYDGEGKGRTTTLTPLQQASQLTAMAELTTSPRYFYHCQPEMDPFDRPYRRLTLYQQDYSQATALPYDYLLCEYSTLTPLEHPLPSGERLTSDNVDLGKIEFTLLLPTSRSYPMIEEPQHWSVLSSLLLSPLFLQQAATLQQLLQQLDFYGHTDLPLSRKIRRYISGITAFTSTPTDWLDRGIPHRAVAITLTLDETQYDNTGDSYLFAKTLHRLLSLWYSENCLLLMEVTLQQSGEQWSLEPLFGHRSLM